MARLVTLQSNWKRGMKQDIPRTAMPDGSAWSLVDFIPELDAPLAKRGGWAYGSNALPSAVAAGAVSNRMGETFPTTGTSKTTSAVLAPAVNRLYLATVYSQVSSGTANDPTLTGGGGLTWVEVATKTQGTSRLTVFRALKTSGLTSGTLVIDWAGQSQSKSWVTVDEAANPDTGGTNGSAAIVQSATGSAASGTTGSATLSAFGDAVNNVGWAATGRDEASGSTNPEAGWTELKDLQFYGGQTQWRLGQDTSPTSTFGNHLWLFIAIEIKTNTSAVTPNYVAAVAYAPFTSVPKLVAISDNGVLSTVNTSTLATTSIGAAVTPLQTAFHVNKLIIPASDGSTPPYYFDGSNLGALAGSPPAGKYVAVYRDRTALAGSNIQPTYVYFSDPGDPTTWDTTNSWISASSSITGLAALPGALMIFQATQTGRVRGSTPPPQTDMILDDPVFNIGCTDARSIAVNPSVCVFANPAGVYMTNGTNLPTDLTKNVGLKRYWQSVLVGYDPASWTIAGGFYQNNYVVAIMNGSTFKDAICFNLDSQSAYRISNLTGVGFANATQISEELWFGLRDEAKVARFSTVYSPSATYKNDSDGTAVTNTWESPLYGTDPAGIKSWRFVYIEYDCRDAASDNPVLTVYCLKHPGGSYVALTPTLVETIDRTRKRIAVRIPGDGMGFKIVQTNASSQTRLYAVQADVHAREQSRL